MEKRLGLYFSNLDTYVNIVGGLRLDEPAADLAVALALVSGLKDIPIDQKLIAFGEIGLSGELRSISRVQARINEAARLGFETILLPKKQVERLKKKPKGVKLVAIRSVYELLGALKEICNEEK